MTNIMFANDGTFDSAIFGWESLLGGLNDFCQIHLQGSRDAQQSFEGWVAHFALDVAHHLLRQAGAFCHKIHGESALLPFLPQNARDAGANGLLGFIGCHL